MEGLKLGGTWGDAVSGVQFLEESVREGHAVGWLGRGEGFPNGVCDVAGEDVRGVFVLNLCEDRLKFFRLAQVVAEEIRVKKFVQALGQLLRRQSPNEISHCPRVVVRDDTALRNRDRDSNYGTHVCKGPFTSEARRAAARQQYRCIRAFLLESASQFRAAVATAKMKELMSTSPHQYHYHPDSFFVARGPLSPAKEDSRSWMAWHFTHRDNLPSIVSRGALAPSSAVTAVTDVADAGIKDRRRTTRVGTPDGYPESVVADHVPWYWAALSPMLFRVKKTADEWNGKPEDLIFFGLNLGDAIDAGLVWCCSDRNASMRVAEFSRNEADLGDFVDFDLLTQKMWNNISEDPDRASRRAAELLVLGEVPLDMIHVTFVASEEIASEVQAILTGHAPSHDLRVVPQLFR